MTPLEKVARAIWLARELNQAERCRMRWEDGTPLARQVTTGLAHAAVLALLNPMNVSLLEPDGTPRHFDDVLASILEQGS